MSKLSLIITACFMGLVGCSHSPKRTPSNSDEKRVMYSCTSESPTTPDGEKSEIVFSFINTEANPHFDFLLHKLQVVSVRSARDEGESLVYSKGVLFKNFNNLEDLVIKRSLLTGRVAGHNMSKVVVVNFSTTGYRESMGELVRSLIINFDEKLTHDDGENLTFTMIEVNWGYHAEDELTELRCERVRQ